VLQGSCWLTPERGDPVALGVGDVVFLPPHAGGHALTGDRPASLTGLPPASLTGPDTDRDDAADAATVLLCGAYLLDGARAHPILAALPAVIHLPARVGRLPELRAAVDLLGAELDDPRQGTDAVVGALLDMLLLYILRAWCDGHAGDESAAGWIRALGDPAISAALRAVHEEPGRAWTVDALAGRGGLSRAAFARRFTALIGRPPLAYLTWWRMTIAARILRESDAPLSSVAARTGYTSEFAFSKAFKREYGATPGRYRRAGRGTTAVLD
jgi:AraC-like DNA-binding protein